MRSALNGVVIVLLVYAAIFAVSEFIFSRSHAGETTRKLGHIFGGAWSAFLPLLVSLRVAIGIGIFLTVFLWWTKRHHLLNSIHSIKRESVGAITYPLGLVLSALCFWDAHSQMIFPGSALVVGLSDGLAGLYGRKYGRMTYDVTGLKSIEGSCVFFAVTVTIIFLILLRGATAPGLGLVLAIVGALLLTVVEGLIGKGWDNLVLPVASGFVLHFML